MIQLDIRSQTKKSDTQGCRDYDSLVFPWVFLIFRDSGMVPKLLYKDVPDSLYIENMGTTLPMVTWCVTNVGHLTALTFQCNFKCKTCLAKYDHRKLMCEQSSYTMTWYEEKTNLQRAWRFLSTNKDSPIKKLLGGTVHKICMLCMFRCADTIWLWKWLKMDVGKSKMVWSGNNGCPRKT